MTDAYCSKCGKAQTGFAQFFHANGELLCESCAVTVDDRDPASIKPAGSRAGHYLYSLQSVALASFLGTPLAGGIVMAINCRRLGKPSGNALLLSLLGTLVVLGFLLVVVVGQLVIPESARILLTLAGYLPPLAGAGLMYYFAYRTQGPAIERHRRAGGEFSSTWGATGIAILCGLGIGIVFSVLLFLVVP